MTPKSSRKLSSFNIALLGVSIASICAALWLSPVGSSVADSVPEGVAQGLPLSGSTSDEQEPAPSPSASPSQASRDGQETDAGDGGTADWTVPGSVAVPVAAGGAQALPDTSEPDPVTPDPVAPTPSQHGGPGPGVPVAQPRIEGCWSFTRQQDAQAVYRKNLSDPYALDGGKGPFNGDGLACTHLPVDSDRKPSKPVGAYVPPDSIATKAQLMAPAKAKYFGVAADGLPGDMGLLDDLSTQVGKAPSMIEWFSTWDEPFNRDKVRASWTRGALPVITWMPGHKGNKNPADISLQKIVDGAWDRYILRYAGDVAREGKPIVLRFAHEPNGNWYPWSAGGNRAFERGDGGQEKFYNTPALFRAAWQHVWDLFDQVGANSDVIWAYSVVNTDAVIPNTTDRSKTTYGQTAIADSYPGDQYVDWVGISAYAYKGSEWSFENTFSRTLDDLDAVAPTKPVLVAETGASETSGSVSNRVRKAEWIEDSLAGFGADPRIVGFVWFNNTVVDVHTIDGQLITTDNKWDTSQLSLNAFRAGVADPVWATGLAPDTVNTTTR